MDFLQQKIKEWLKGGSYADGVALYSQCRGVKPNLLRIFNKGESAANVAKLKYELGKAAASMPKPAATSSGNKSAAPASGIPAPPARRPAVQHETPQAQHQPVFFHELPEALRPVLLEANDLFRKNCMLKATLNDVPPEAEARAFSLQMEIFTNLQRNRLCWQQIDYWLKHKKMPPVARGKFDDFSPAKLEKRQRQLFSNVSRTEKRLKANKALLEVEDTLRGKTRLQKAIAKQEESLLRMRADQIEVARLIDQPAKKNDA